MSSTDLSIQTAGSRSARKLLVVMHMDMVGYSRLIGLDDTGTLSRAKALRQALIEPAIDEHGGRIIQTAGDSFLNVFDSIEGALGCALKVQRLIPAYDGLQPPERQIRFRIGIEIGDIITDGADVHGDVVNVAVRLQSACPPGGICVSRAVRDHVRARADLVFESMGPLSLKNIASPVEAFSLRPSGVSAKPQPAATPSMVVLPFDNRGGDAAEHWLADAITDDLTTELSRFSGTPVRAHNLGHIAEAKLPAIAQIGRDLSAAYVLHGSVRTAGDRLWINTHLIDAATGTLIHADRLPCLTQNYDEAISRVVRSVKLALTLDRRKRIGARPITDLGVADLLILGRDALLRPLSPENYATALAYFERALELEPGSVDAQAAVAGSLVGAIFDGWSSKADDDKMRAERLLNSALAHEANHPLAHVSMALLRRLQNRLEDSRVEWEIAIALDPHNPMAFAQLGLVLMCIGRLDAAIANIEKAICLSPAEPSVAVSYSMLGACHLLRKDSEKALELARKAHALNPRLYYNHLLFAAAFGLAGNIEDAAQALATARGLKPEFNTLDRLLAAHPWLTDARYRSLAEPTFALGLRRAGMPDA